MTSSCTWIPFIFNHMNNFMLSKRLCTFTEEKRTQQQNIMITPNLLTFTLTERHAKKVPRYSDILAHVINAHLSRFTQRREFTEKGWISRKVTSIIFSSFSVSFFYFSPRSRLIATAESCVKFVKFKGLSVIKDSCVYIYFNGRRSRIPKRKYTYASRQPHYSPLVNVSFLFTGSMLCTVPS